MTNTDYRLTPDAVHGRVITGAEQIRRARCRLLLEALGIDEDGKLITW